MTNTNNQPYKQLLFIIDYLRLYSGLTIKAISEQLGVSVSSIYKIRSDGYASEKTALYLLRKIKRTFPEEYAFVEKRAAFFEEVLNEQ